MIETQEYRHNSGLKVILAKMPGYSEKFAMFTTKYGSVDSVLRNETAVGGTIDVPLGTAHFLEHKLFEQKDIDIMSKYAELGARPNAFTSHTQTSYLFSCTENFDKCLDLLLDFVQTPFFTDENVEKEKGIIGQEINMYLDNPDSVVYTVEPEKDGITDIPQFRQPLHFRSHAVEHVTVSHEETVASGFQYIILENAYASQGKRHYIVQKIVMVSPQVYHFRTIGLHHLHYDIHEPGIFRAPFLVRGFLLQLPSVYNVPVHYEAVTFHL